jgi:hypothetical protein
MKRKLLFYAFLAGALAAQSLPAAIVLHSKLTHESVASPGQAYSGSIEIGNSSDQPQDVRVLLTDYRSNAAGESMYDVPAGQMRSNAGWIDYSPEYLTLPAKGTALISYNVKVPPLDTLRGSYWCVLMIEPMTKIDPFHIEKTLQISSKVRYAIKIVTNIGAANKEVTFLASEIISKEQAKALQVDLGNDGDSVVRPTLSLQLFDLEGTSAGTFSAEYQTIFPECAKRYLIPLDASLGGQYKALLVADCGEDSLFGISFNLEIEPAPLDIKPSAENMSHGGDSDSQ